MTEDDDSTPTTVLVVDDDAEMRGLIGDYLDRNGYRSRLAPSVPAARELLAREAAGLVILDIMLPGEDGLSFCRELRVLSDVPVIMLTARGDPMDRILGLEMGADDYLPKPFEPRELLARMRSVLRRTRGQAGGRVRGWRFGAWQLDRNARHLQAQDGTVVPLSGAEFRLLSTFLERPGRVLSRDQLMQATQGRDAEAFDRAVDLAVSRLRQRLGDDARRPVLIKTVRNEGYVFAAPVSPLV